ncbi:MAG: bifunctional demethylmenaquinone methyltransferase/2-methoxy-6-polyprenyl-1,4-benzoquinol methylase UbiE [Bacteroidaceae bacterium]|nr:bifunctional demethylmenaquinone methyltransferase/2-methoxy-6-polyprenyl-1,4-benzoquinol methylase UbiE [Bacteroidaceae bacterium]
MKYTQETIKPYAQDGEKAEQVERMFDGIAPRYDLLNHLLSFGIDRRWRRAAIRSLQPYSPQDVLDVATGTGDFALLEAQMLPEAKVTGLDLSEGMLAVGREKVRKSGNARVSFEKGDVLALPYADASFDAVTVAYGARNFADLDRGLAEMRRVLRPGGRLVICELTTPRRAPMSWLFAIYSKVYMPLMGKLLGGDGAAYRYLPATMAAFPQGERMARILGEIGYTDVRFKRFTFGLNTLYTAAK